MIKQILETPSVDTGQITDLIFTMKSGSATLTLRFSEHSDFSINFTRVRWHKFTAIYNCSSDMIGRFYHRLCEISDSQELDIYIKSDRASRKAYHSLHHFRIFIDEIGCHEIFAESASSESGAA